MRTQAPRITGVDRAANVSSDPRSPGKVSDPATGAAGTEVTSFGSLVIYERIQMTQSRQKAAAPLPAAPADGCTRIESAVRELQRQLAAAAALGSAGVEDVHRGRVAARRLRSLLKTFRPLLEARRARLYRVDLRSFARALGGVREADVRRELLTAVAVRDGSIPPADLERLASLLEDACIAVREALHRHQSEPGWAALLAALKRHAERPDLFVNHAADLSDVLKLVAASWRRPVRLLEDEPETTLELHELRLSLKHCRYALEPVADVAPKATARLLRRLRDAQDCIGEHRDTLLATHWARSNERLLGRDFAARLATDLDHRESLLRRRATKRSHKVLMAWRDWRTATRRLRKGGKTGRA